MAYLLIINCVCLWVSQRRYDKLNVVHIIESAAKVLRTKFESSGTS